MSISEPLAQKIDAERLHPAVRAPFVKGRELHPDDPERIEIAIAIKDLGHFAPAIELFETITPQAEFYTRFKALIAMGECHIALGQLDRALPPLTEAQTMDPGSDWPLWPLIDANQKIDPDLALAQIAQAYEETRPDGRARLARRNSEIRAERAYAAAQAAWTGLHLPGSVPALSKAGLVMMAKDEADIITANLEHHYSLGFRSFCLLDNNSADETGRLIAAFRDSHPDALVLLVHDPIVGYYQAAKMAVFQQTLRDYAAIEGRTLEWMFFIDADEFIAFSGSDDAAATRRFEHALSDENNKIIVLQWVNSATQEALESLPAESADLLALFTRRPAILRPAVPKVALRCGTGMTPEMGNHFVESLDYPLEQMYVLAEDGWFMLHAPLRSIEHVRKKVINGGRAFHAAQGLETSGGHWRQRYDMYVAQGEPALHQILQHHIVSCQ